MRDWRNLKLKSKRNTYIELTNVIARLENLKKSNLIQGE